LEFSHDCAEPVGELKIKKYEITLPEKMGLFIWCSSTLTLYVPESL